MIFRKFFLFLFFLTSLSTFSQPKVLKFKHLTSNEGLSQDHVSSILKDRKGFMWFATDEGLNKYDGYKFTIYKHDPDNSKSISSNFVIDILEDNLGNLWIGTLNGLDKFDQQHETFIHYNPSNTTFSVRDIFQDSKNRIWIGTTYGLYLFDPLKNTFITYRHNKKEVNSISDNFVYRIAEYNKSELWIATRDGLNRFNVDDSAFYSYRSDPKNKTSIAANRIKTVYKSKDGNIWIGTQGGGLSLYNREKDSFTNFKNDPNNKKSISHNDILSIAEDKNGTLWVGTENGGLNLFNNKTNTFSRFQNDAADNESLSNNSVYYIYKDDINNMWVGTWSGGINFLSYTERKFDLYQKIAGNENSLSNNIVLSINGDDDGNIWIGTDGGGINCINWESKIVKHYTHQLNDSNSPSSDYVLYITNITKDILGIGYHRGGFDFFNKKTGRFSHHMPEVGRNDPTGLSVHVVYKDSKSNVWVGTLDRSGLYYYDSGKFSSYGVNGIKFDVHYSPDPNDDNSISGSTVFCVFEDTESNLWFGTNKGLDRFDKKKNRFIHHRFDPLNKKSISNDVVYSITEDHAGNLWIGTGGGGLNFFDRKKQTFTAYTTKDGLSSNVIYGILEDSHGNLWFSSNKGLSRFNPVDKTCRNYNVSDGLQGNSFKPNAYYKSKTGEMFFGGANGFNVFHPDSIRDNLFIPPVAITGLQIFNKPVEVSENSVLLKPISDIDAIKLTYKQSVFTLEFAALNYISPEMNQYAYKLEGFDKEWNYVGNKRTATYTNLNAGEYIFKVKGSNNDGIWNETGASLKIIIVPPLWKTWWFKVLVAIASLSSVVIFYRMRIKTIQKQKARLKRKVRKRTRRITQMNEEIKRQASEIIEINENLEKLVRQRTYELEGKNRALKEYAFINAHKVRGPVASILGLIDLISREDLPEETRELLEYLKDSANSLDSIVRSITKVIDGDEKPKLS